MLERRPNTDTSKHTGVDSSAFRLSGAFPITD